jgi:hypothetical protein
MQQLQFNKHSMHTPSHIHVVGADVDAFQLGRRTQELHQVFDDVQPASDRDDGTSESDSDSDASFVP